MARDREFPIKPASSVDWSDPQLQSLLQRTEGWKIDNRGSVAPKDVWIHLRWGTATVKKAVLVWERDDVIVLEADFPIPQGEHVRVDSPSSDGVKIQWGEVVQSRLGQRPGDQAKGIQVHWLSVCEPND